MNSGIGIAGFFLLVSCNLAPLQVITDEQEVFEGVEEVYIRGGSLEVSYTGSEGADKVEMDIFLESNQPNLDGISYKKRDNRLEIEMHDDIGFGFWTGRTKGHIQVSGPKNMALDIHNSSGTLEIRNVANENFDFRISSGKMHIRDVEAGLLRLKASSGKLEAEKIVADVELELSSGWAEVRNVTGDVNFKGSSGSISIRDVRGTVAGKISSGKVSLEDIDEVGELGLSSGMLTADDVGLGPESSFWASSGYLRVRTHSPFDDFNFDFSVGSGHLTVGKRSGSNDIKIDNGSPHTVKGKIQSGKMEIVGGG